MPALSKEYDFIKRYKPQIMELNRIKTWEKKQGKETVYIMLFENRVAVGSHYGNTQTDNAGWASIKEFADGKFHAIIKSRLGEELLQEVLAFIKENMPEIFED